LMHSLAEFTLLASNRAASVASQSFFDLYKICEIYDLLIYVC
jgi:hypothetical protein